MNLERDEAFINESKIRVYLDLEYVFPGMSSTSGRPSSDVFREIVQIAAIKFDHSQGEEIEFLNLLVWPPHPYYLNDFFTELTGITLEQIAESDLHFSTTFSRLVQFCEDLPIWVYDKDGEVLDQNCDFWHIRNPLSKIVRVKPYLQSKGIDPEQYSSGTLYKAAGLSLEGHVHNALHDVRSMAIALHVIDRTT